MDCSSAEDGEIIDETICIVRDQPFTPEQQVTCIASLCQDHPLEERNRFNALFDSYCLSTKVGG